MNKFVTIAVIISSLLLSGCDFRKKTVDIGKEISPSPTTSIEEREYIASNPIELFLVELTKSTKLSFSNPIKSDIIWREGDSPTTLKSFFADSFMINNSNPGVEDEKIVENYFINNGFEYMKFNESVGDDSHRVGYRKENLVCKFDKSKFPDEETAHLIVYCADASTGKEM